MVRNVILGGRHDRRSGTAVATCGVVGIHGGQIEATLEPTPGSTDPVQKIADILPSELNCGSRGGGADITQWIIVTVQAEVAIAVVNETRCAIQIRGNSVGLAGNQVDGPGSG